MAFFTPDSTIRSFFELPYQTVIQLPWGDPPKPYLFKGVFADAKLQGTCLIFHITSPVLKEPLTLKITLGVREPFSLFEVFFSDGWRSIATKIAPNDSNMHKALKNVWAELKKADVIKSDVKVASSNLTLEDVLQGVPKELTLPWGNPPKPYLFKCVLSETDQYFIKYEVTSPLLNTPIKLFFSYMSDRHCHVEAQSSDRAGRPLQLCEKEYSHGDSFQKSLSDFWKTWKNKGLSDAFKPDVKLASAKKTKAKKRKENPKSIDRYVKEYAEQKGYGSAEEIPSNEKGKAYAIAWSRYCSKRPGSPRCKKDKGTYFPNRPNISKGIAKSMEDKRRKRMGKKASDIMIANVIAGYTPKSPAQNSKNQALITYLQTNEILRFVNMGDRSGRAGVYFYPVGFSIGRKNPPNAIYLSGREIAIMAWVNGKWLKESTSPLKTFQENPQQLNRALKVIKRRVDNA